VALSQPFRQKFGGLDDAWSHRGEGALLGCNAGGEMLFDACERFHHVHPMKFGQ